MKSVKMRLSLCLTTGGIVRLQSKNRLSVSAAKLENSLLCPPQIYKLQTPEYNYLFARASLRFYSPRRRIPGMFCSGTAMETAAMCNPFTLSRNHLFKSKPGDKSCAYRWWHTVSGRMVIATSATAPGKGGGVLDRPTKEKSPPGRESEFDLKKKKKMSPPFRVILHNDDFNRREYVVQVLMKVIPGMTLDNAVNIMQEAHHNGLSVVIICSQAEAEEHCMELRKNGLLSSIEPAVGGC